MIIIPQEESAEIIKARTIRSAALLAERDINFNFIGI